MIALFELFLWLTYIYDIRRQMQIYGAHDIFASLARRRAPKHLT